MNWNTLNLSYLHQTGLEVTATYNGSTIKGIKTTIKRSDRNSDLGLIEGDYQFSLLCLTSYFQTFPAPRKSKITIDNVTYRILSYDVDAAGKTIKLNLGNIAQ